MAGEERARIARDVHDIVTHSLSVMIALTDGVACALPGSPRRAAEAAGKASEIGRQAIAEMRGMLRVLRDGEPTDGNRQPRPGLSQLDGLFTEVRVAGFPVEFVVTGAPRVMASGAELAIFRIIQKALTNIRKHTARGTTARVRINYTAESVDIEVTDDGRRDGPVAAEHPGHGITGTRERVAVYGGLVYAGPLPGGGWRVHARFEPAQLERTR